jgi:CHAD domain-containing protein
LLATTQWLEALTLQAVSNPVTIEPDVAPRRWVRERIKRLHRQLKRSHTKAQQAEQLHRVRILAKRMRYNLAALQALLPRKLTQRWLDQANQLQAELGTVRDATRAAALVAEMEGDHGPGEFLRGFAASRQTVHQER